MEQGPREDFQSLRAKFQEDAALKQITSKPALPQKPRQVPPSSSRSSVLTSINLAMESKMPVIPRVVFKDDKKGLSKKRPQSQPTSPTSPKGKQDDMVHRLSAEVLNLNQKQEPDNAKPAHNDGKVPVKEGGPTPGPAPLTPAQNPPPQCESPAFSSTPTLNPENKTSKGSPKAVSGTAESSAFTEAQKLENGIAACEPGESQGTRFPEKDRPAALESKEPKAEVQPISCKTPPCDKRVLRALEKAKKKTPPVQPLLLSETTSLPQEEVDPMVMDNILLVLPPIDYQDPLMETPIQTCSDSPPAAEINGLSQNLEFSAQQESVSENAALVMSQLEAPDHEGFEVSTLVASDFPDHWASGFNPAESHAPEFEAAGPDDMDCEVSKQEAGHGDLEHKDPLAEMTGPINDPMPVPGAQSPNESPVSHKDAQNGKKGRKGKRNETPKNPYEAEPMTADAPRNSWFRKSRQEKGERKGGPSEPGQKELKKKEKQRLEKEKKEQKEREKKESRLKKKFQITGQEEAMYEARVTVSSKGRRNGLAVKSGDIISIIRTNNCPKGKWLARSADNNYGYISVERVELDIHDMMELGKKAAKAAGHGAVNGEATSMGSRSSNQLPLSSGSFSDDSEEWTDDEAASPSGPRESQYHPAPEITRQSSLPETQNNGSPENNAPRLEALQKLATFFENQRVTEIPPSERHEPSITNAEEPSYAHEQEEDSQMPMMDIIPPPALYADALD